MCSHKLQVRYINTAIADLTEILVYTERQWGERQRAMYRQLILRTVDTLARSPSIGRSQFDLLQGLRSYPVGSHMLYYWTEDSTIVTARVLHSRQEPNRETWSELSAPEWLPGDDVDRS